jgi:hypothetical protein
MNALWQITYTLQTDRDRNILVFLPPPPMLTFTVESSWDVQDALMAAAKRLTAHLALEQMAQWEVTRVERLR